MSDAAQIRRRRDGWVKAFRAKDVNGVMSLYAPEVVSFDLVPPRRYVGADAYRKPWKEAFAAYQGAIDSEVHDLSITTGNNVAFSHSLNRMGGTMQDGQQTESWLRWTCCYRKVKGEWLVTHEHVSVPFYMDGSDKAATDLEP